MRPHRRARTTRPATHSARATKSRRSASEGQKPLSLKLQIIAAMLDSTGLVPLRPSPDHRQPAAHDRHDQRDLRLGLDAGGLRPFQPRRAAHGTGVQPPGRGSPRTITRFPSTCAKSRCHPTTRSSTFRTPIWKPCSTLCKERRGSRYRNLRPAGSRPAAPAIHGDSRTNHRPRSCPGGRFGS